MFNFIKSHLQKIYSNITSKLSALFGSAAIDAETLKKLELILLQADTGVQTTRHIIEKLKEQHRSGSIKHGSDLKDALHNILLEILTKQTISDNHPDIILLVGINGSGKTTLAAKLAYQYRNKKVLFVAADTFRAAAPEQLQSWAAKTDVAIEMSTPGQDPASVVFTGCQRYKDDQFNLMIVDTAGRLQNKSNLMHELEKIRRVIGKQLPDKKVATFLTIDAMLGQNSFEQAKLFHESTQLSGIILTKMDGSGKGGIVFSIADQLHVPVIYISYGEQLEHFKPFNAHTYVQELLSC